jgi:N-acyl-D-aspartate/D-glutamate deacylase
MTFQSLSRLVVFTSGLWCAACTPATQPFDLIIRGGQVIDGTGRAAERPDRGLIRSGYLADVVVFNPKTVKENATYERPHQYPTGIDYVVVNGVPVLDPKGLTGARPGRPLYVPARQP